MLDLLIRGALIVDGTGAPARHGDIGVKDGRIVVDPDDSATRTVDAGGLALSPGFIDLHTHYDAQLSWDGTASPSPLHGVTTIMGGNCGFTLTPTLPEHITYLKRLMARVEGMSLSALEQGASWDWTDFADWTGRLEGGLGVNAGFLVGHSAIRRLVMGSTATSDEASPEQIAQMVAVLHESLAAGGMGFSTSLSITVADGDGNWVPSAFASREELLALAAAVADHPGTTLGINPKATATGSFSDDEADLLIEMSRVANRPMNWNVLRVSAQHPEFHEMQLTLSDQAAKRGARLIALTVPHPMRLRVNFNGIGPLDMLPGWKEILHLPFEERKAALADPEVRRRMADGAKQETGGGFFHDVAQWDRMVVAEVFSEQYRFAEGKSLGAIAAELGRDDPFEVMCDIVLADELRTGLEPELGRISPEENKMRADVWRDPRCVVGGSDAGAHLDMMCGAVYTTSVLGDAVRDQQVITLEEGVHLLSDEPAQLYGLRERGRIADGYHADLVLFDPATVHDKPARMRHDLPSGAPRLYAEAEGIHHVWVNGTETVTDGTLTGALPGDVIRSGTDSYTVHATG